MLLFHDCLIRMSSSFALRNQNKAISYAHILQQRQLVESAPASWKHLKARVDKIDSLSFSLHFQPIASLLAMSLYQFPCPSSLTKKACYPLAGSSAAIPTSLLSSVVLHILAQTVILMEDVSMLYLRIHLNHNW